MENILIVIAFVLLVALMLCYSAYRKLKSDNWVLEREKEEHLKTIEDLRKQVRGL